MYFHQRPYCVCKTGSWQRPSYALRYVLIRCRTATKSLSSNRPTNTTINKQRIFYGLVQIGNACDAATSYMSVVLFEFQTSLFFCRIARTTSQKAIDFVLLISEVQKGLFYGTNEPKIIKTVY